MHQPTHPDNEAQRLASLQSLHILDTEAEERFDRYTRLAKHAFAVPIALVSLVDANRQWFKSRQGLDASETPREISFCGHAILGDDVFVIENASGDERFCDNPLVQAEPNIRFYAGCPLRGPEGHRIGTLCIIDRRPRSFSDEDRCVLQDIGHMVSDELKSRQLALTDALTGISNRRGFEMLSAQALAMCKRAGRSAIVVVIDMDDFKAINDEHGHHAGDQVLCRFADLLVATFRESDVVARTGGDEFCVLLTGTSISSAQSITDRLQIAADVANREAGTPYRMAFSAGVASYQPDRHAEISDALQEADARMYERKQQRKTSQRDVAAQSAGASQ